MLKQSWRNSWLQDCSGSGVFEAGIMQPKPVKCTTWNRTLLTNFRSIFVWQPGGEQTGRGTNLAIDNSREWGGSYVRNISLLCLRHADFGLRFELNK